MEKYIEVTIKKDPFGDLAQMNKKENINMILNEINVLCFIKNKDYLNIIEDQKGYETYKKDYSNSVNISAKGYTQSEWQEYTLFYDIDKDNKIEVIYLNDLIKHLERTFTHDNNYLASKREVIIIEGKEFKEDPHDYTTFCITWDEFPDKKEVQRSYNDFYGKDYDKLFINLD